MTLSVVYTYLRASTQPFLHPSDPGQQPDFGPVLLQ